MMKILFRCDEYPPALTGGIGVVTKMVAESLVKRGHVVFVYGAFCANQNLPKNSEINGVRIYRRPLFVLMAKLHLLQGQRFCFITKLFTRVGIMAQLVRKVSLLIHADIESIISTHGIQIMEHPDYTSLSGFYTERMFIPFQPYSIPLVARVHGSPSFLSFHRTGIISDICRRNDVDFFNKATRVVAVSKYSAAFLKKQLEIDNDIDVIYNPLVSLFSRQGLSEDLVPVAKHNILFVGKIVETKGAFILIKTFNAFHRSFPDYELHLVGGGNIDAASQMVDKESVGSVFFEGYRTSDEIAEFIHNATFCVIPSRYENFSMAALEIMSMGRALVYTNTSSGPELIEDGVNGLLVNPEDEHEILSAMLRLASDDEFRKLIGLNAEKRVETHFSQNIIITKLENCYKSMIEIYNTHSISS